MIIENLKNMDAVRDRFAEFQQAEFIGQQIVLRSSIDALEFLVGHRDQGVTPEQMLEMLREELMALHEAANKRGIDLVSYS